jgi:hypothetical protein
MSTIEHKKNTAYYLALPMIDSTTPASYKTGASPADTAYYKDGAGAWTSLAITDTFSEIGSTGVYEIDLTAAEMNHDQVLIKVTASGAADDMVMFDMRVELAEDIAGAGAIEHEVTVNEGGNPSDGAEVWVTTDIGGANVVAGTLSTDASGNATFMLDAGSYYLWAQKSGVNFTNPTAFTVS